MTSALPATTIATSTVSRRPLPATTRNIDALLAQIGPPPSKPTAPAPAATTTPTPSPPDELPTRQMIDGRCHTTLFRHSKPVRCSALSADGKFLFTTTQSGYRVHVWDAQTGQQLCKTQPSLLWTNADHVSPSPDGKYVAALWDIRMRSFGRGLTIQEVSSGKTVWYCYTPLSNSAVKWSPSGRSLRFSDAYDGDTVLSISSFTTTKVKPNYVGHTPDETVLTLEDKRVAGGSYNFAHDNSLKRARLSRSGRYLLTAETNATVNVWNVESQTIALRLPGVLQCALADDDQVAVTVRHDKVELHGLDGSGLKACIPYTPRKGFLLPYALPGGRFVSLVEPYPRYDVGCAYIWDAVGGERLGLDFNGSGWQPNALRVTDLVDRFHAAVYDFTREPQQHLDTSGLARGAAATLALRQEGLWKLTRQNHIVALWPKDGALIALTKEGHADEARAALAAFVREHEHARPDSIDVQTTGACAAVI